MPKNKRRYLVSASKSKYHDVSAESSSRRLVEQSCEQGRQADPIPGDFAILRVDERARRVLANDTALKRTTPQNRNGSTETRILPSVVCFTVKPTSFSAVVSPTVTSNIPLHVTACAALSLDLMTIVSSSL